MKRYILNAQGEPEECPDLETWARWFESNRNGRVVRQTIFEGWHEPHVEEVRLSTVFLALDHRWLSDGPPLLFETMSFYFPPSQLFNRYSTRAQALEGHERMLKVMRNFFSQEGYRMKETELPSSTWTQTN